MKRIQNRHHPKEAFFLAVSRMFERASYYGARAIITLYMVGETFKMNRSEALEVYGTFMSAMLLGPIIGGVLGDLVLGNKKTILIGGIIQAIGLLCLCIPSKTGLYAGIFLIAFGSGLFTPNLISNFGKSYLNQPKLLDSGFTLLYFAVNLGAFLGIMLIGNLGETYDYSIGFVIAAVLALVSLIPVFMTKEKQLKFDKTQLSIGKRTSHILVVLIAVGIVYGIHEIASFRVFELRTRLSEMFPASGVGDYFWNSANLFFLIPLSLMAAIVWTYYYNSQLYKVVLACVFGILSFGMLLLIPELPTANHTIIYMVSLIFLGISEIHIAPVVYSILTRFANPKYLAIFISLSIIPTRLMAMLLALSNEKFYDNPVFGLYSGIAVLLLMGAGVYGYLTMNRKLSA